MFCDKMPDRWCHDTMKYRSIDTEQMAFLSGIHVFHCRKNINYKSVYNCEINYKEKKSRGEQLLGVFFNKKGMGLCSVKIVKFLPPYIKYLTVI